jgi:hypothetical protein
MSKPELDNLVRIERLKTEPPTQNEYLGMVAAARSRLTDAQNEDLDPDSRFDLAYGAAHRLALAALRREDTARKTVSLSSRRLCIRWVRQRRTCKSFCKRTTSGT